MLDFFNTGSHRDLKETIRIIKKYDEKIDGLVVRQLMEQGGIIR